MIQNGIIVEGGWEYDIYPESWPTFVIYYLNGILSLFFFIGIFSITAFCCALCGACINCCSEADSYTYNTYNYGCMWYYFYLCYYPCPGRFFLFLFSFSI
eukprot:TRINITY_DN3486_c0_g1_i2.p1 TRINITY_DN3486_c0_g1~~TRINITY_DN3486_c0_g1_i2.p1  ORF type:complete len:100 (-),score=5.79 TRINITY_DN3486_c0_g1_i2:45-344(-)